MFNNWKHTGKQMYICIEPVKNVDWNVQKKYKESQPLTTELRKSLKDLRRLPYYNESFGNTLKGFGRLKRNLWEITNSI